jgi:SMP-30/gluconolaconase/LRE-like protein
MRRKWLLRPLAVILAVVPVVVAAAPAYASTHDTGTVFVTTAQAPALQFPEGITAWNGYIFTGTLNVIAPAAARVLVFDQNHNLINTINGPNGTDLGFMNGLIINHTTGDLYISGNETGMIYRVLHPAEPQLTSVSVYAELPTLNPAIPPGPEDMAFNQYGDLYISDSNYGLIYKIAAGGCGASTSCAQPWVGPPATSAHVSSMGNAIDPTTGQPIFGDLFASVAPGLSPNGLAFSPDFRTFYVANTGQDAIDAFPVTDGQVTGPGRVFASSWNPAVESDPTAAGYGVLLTGVLGATIGGQASTALNGPDGLATDQNGEIWVADVLGDNVAEVCTDGSIQKTFGKSAVTDPADGGLLNMPASVTFSGLLIYTTNLAMFTGLAGTTNSWSVTSYNAGVHGAQSNGNL